MKNDLAVAASKGDVKEVTRLLASGAKVNSWDSRGMTPLHEAVRAGNKEVVELLIAHGADVNLRRNGHQTPLITAIDKGRQGLAEILIAHGANLDAVDSFGAALHYAVLHRNEDLVDLLVAKGADVNVKNYYGVTPLHLALDQPGNWMDYDETTNNIVVLLIVKGADVKAKNEKGQTPIDLASAKGNKLLPELYAPTYKESKPSFDCKDARQLTFVESEICAIPQLRYLDQQLADAYSAALKGAKKPKIVKDEQREWLRYRNEKCNQRTPECMLSALVDMYNRRIALLKLPVHENPERIVNAIPVPGATAEERIAFLKNYSIDWDHPETRKNEIPYILGALQDASAEVRKIAADDLFDESLLPQMIRTMVSDPDPRVRQTAAISISSFITSNGTDDCNSANIIDEYLDEFLIGLRDDATFQFVLEVLGGGYAGSTPLPCCLPSNDKARVVTALESWRNVRPVHNIVASSTSGDVNEALRHIEECSAVSK